MHCRDLLKAHFLDSPTGPRPPQGLISPGGPGRGIEMRYRTAHGVPEGPATVRSRAREY
jgi:hypothetical protein